jgi:hypothetical protein
MKAGFNGSSLADAIQGPLTDAGLIGTLGRSELAD